LRLNPNILLPLLLGLPVPDQAQQKNVLLIVVDDLKPVLGCYGSETILTPNMDRLATEGVLFQNNYCQKAVSGPSRSSLLTGKRPDHIQVWNMSSLIRDVNPDIITLPQYFKNNGYETAGIGKVFDPRNVDSGHDAISWTIPYTANWKLPLAEGYEDILFGSYQSQAVRDSVAYYYDRAADLGLTGSAAEDYVKDHVKPSVESAPVPDDAYREGAFANEAIRLLNEFSGGTKPFFLAVGFKKPHLPFVAPQKYWDMYNREEMPLANFQSKALYSPECAFHNSEELRGYTDIPDFSRFSNYEEAILDADQQKELIHGYYACTSYIDALVGKVLDELDRLDMRKNTIVLLFGDHGWHLGDHGLWGKHTNFEQATRAPLIISAPGYSTNSTSWAITEFLDIYPTLCELANLPVPSDLDGRSLVPNLADPVSPGKEFAVSQYSRDRLNGYTIRTGRYRYTEWFANGYRSFDPYLESNISYTELYDYQTDPEETENLAGAPAYSVLSEELHTALREFLENGSIPLGRELPGNSAGEEYLVCPNPFSDRIMLGTDHEVSGPVLVRVYSPEGKLLHLSKAMPSEPIDLSGLKRGLFLLQVDGIMTRVVKK